jgi:hypothetical protein
MSIRPRTPPLQRAAPELNPVARVRLYLCERFLPHGVPRDYDASLDPARQACKRLLAETGRLASPTAYPWLFRSELPWAGMTASMSKGSCPAPAREAPTGQAATPRIGPAPEKAYSRASCQ